MDTSQQIDRYLQGLMTDSERKEFEDLMRSNLKLANAVRLRKELLEFAGSYEKKIDAVIMEEDRFMQELTLNEWDQPENKPLVDTIRTIIYYVEVLDQSKATEWLKSDAIMYPELVNEILDGIDHDRFRNKLLDMDEIQQLNRNLQDIYSMYLSIDSAVDDYLYTKNLENPASKKGKGGLKILDNTDQSVKKRPARSMRLNKLFLFSVAASVILLVSSVLVWLLLFSGPSDEQLYMAYYKPMAAPMEMRGNGSSSQDLFSRGMDSYNKADYSAAFSALISVPKDNPAYYPSQLFSGISAMEMSNYDEAISHFKVLTEGNQSNLKADAQWYLALCYLKKGDSDLCMKTLDALKENTYYKDQVNALLSEMAR
jgi:hypothetical protein